MPEPRVVAIVQARMGSSRLPGKVLARVVEKTLLEHLVERLRRARTLSDIFIATTNQPADDAIENEAVRLGVSCFRGDEDDVLARFDGAASASAADVVVRVTADCPLLDPAEVDKVVSAFLVAKPQVDYAANFAPYERKIPLGLSVEVMTRAALSRACRDGLDKHHREHVTPYLYESPGRFSSLVVHPPRNLAHLRLTVDTAEDLSVVTAVLEAIDREPDRTSLSAALRFLEENPAVALRNTAVRQRAFDESAPDGRVDGLSLLVRADATPDIGAGHAMRAFAIAEAWVLAGGRAACLGRLPPSLAHRFVEAAVEVLSLPTSVHPGSAEDAKLVQETAQRYRADVMLFDGYEFHAPYLRAVRHDRMIVGYIDDFTQLDLPVDVIVDPNVGASSTSRGAGITLLAGGMFTPLRAEFARAVVPERSFDTSPRKLLLTFGASDPARLSVRALRAALAVAQRVPLRVIVLAGPMHPDLAALDVLAAPETAVVVHDAREVAPLFASVDLAFAAAGSTTFELAALGVPTLLVQIADNQRAIIDPMTTFGAARRIDIDAIMVDANLEQFLEQFVTTESAILRTMSVAARRSVDRRGTARILRTLGALVMQRSQGTKESS